MRTGTGDAAPRSTLTLTEVRDLMERHGVSPRKGFGQNFVVDPNTIRRIVTLAGVGPGERVLEIGPGLGSLTLGLASSGARVTAVERDPDLIPVLEDVLAGWGVDLVPGDATRLDWPALLGGREWVLVANLPYNVATGLVLDLARHVPQVVRMLVMVQREVAERLVAAPGSRTYGVPSVKLAAVADSRIVGAVPPTVFLPQPRVMSALVEIVRRPEGAPDAGWEAFDLVVSRGFAQRRKTLRSSLAGVVDAEGLAAAGVDSGLRAEALSAADFARVAKHTGVSGG